MVNLKEENLQKGGLLEASGRFLKSRPLPNDLHAFITSSYYYPTSKSLGNNSIGLVFLMNFEEDPEIKRGFFEKLNKVEHHQIRILAENESDSVEVTTDYQIVTVHRVCRMIPIFVTATLLPNMKNLYVVGDTGKTQIPFTPVSYEKKDVVVCISPLFLNENWQMFLLAMHTYKRYGAFVNLYMSSAISTVYDLIKLYENEGYLRIQPWVQAKFPGVPDEMLDSYAQTEFRNQAGAQTDCILQFKESSKFVALLDLDDILIPKLAPTYFEEFTRVMREFPATNYMHYKKINYQTQTALNPLNYDIDGMFRNLEYVGTIETPKMIVPTDQLHHTWIHWTTNPGHVKTVVKNNAITHFKKVEVVDHPKKSNVSAPLYWNKNDEFIMKEEDLLAIQEDYERMASRDDVADILGTVENDQFYAKIISKCWKTGFYKRIYYDKDTPCPGTQLCTYPQRMNYMCMRHDAKIQKRERQYPITFYFAEDVTFSTANGCIP
ncbi:unnamed protein product [Caenorhabditis bovis]|uniref:Glycosyltransferase family 92 protein n=1 Tax=Caenorhabditis bovis TaxID=2654633 RepID=A0A8S1EYB6_9PELO|nr:unnamed protein product [Caenorhabditis bovis]